MYELGAEGKRYNLEVETKIVYMNDLLVLHYWAYALNRLSTELNVKVDDF